MSDIIIKFEAQNHKEVENAIKNINKEHQKYNSTVGKGSGKLKQHGKETGLLVGHQRLLNSSFATLRSNLLLVNFALGLGIRQLAGYAKEAAKLESVNRAFESMSGSSVAASVGLEKLRQATNNTMSDFDLFRQANSAMLLGITDDIDAMAEMFDMAQRLGRALGNDTVQSVEALIFGLGRMSVKRLDDIGIIVKANDAYRQYAAANRTVASELTGAQKRQAFFNAALESGRQKLASQGGELLTNQDRLDELSASFENLQTRVGAVVLEFAPLIDKATKFMDAIDVDTIRTMSNAVISLGSAFLILKGGIKIIEKAVLAMAVAFAAGIGWIGSFRVALTALMGGPFGLAMSVLTGAIFLWRQYGTEVEEAAKTQKQLRQEFEDTILLMATPGIFEGQWASYLDFSQAYLDSITPLVEKIKEQRQAEKDASDQEAQDADTKERLLELFGKTDDARSRSLNILKERALILKEKGKLDADELAALDKLIKKLEKVDATEQKMLQNKLKGTSLAIKGFADLVGMNEKNAKAAAGIQAAAAIVDAWSAALSTKAQVAKYAPSPFPELAFAGSLASGLVAARQIAMSANQIGSGGGASGNIYGSFEQGGYVGGNRHSQGGTIIEAERGEFVMSRNAVESIGLETLNQMNQGGGGGNINVSVTGNVLTQDFVEGELAESIKEAVRRGSDFGIG